MSEVPNRRPLRVDKDSAMITATKEIEASANDLSTNTTKQADRKPVTVPPPLTKYPPYYPPFPEPGSILGGRYFVLERLGQGTFCSIHKCIDLSYLPHITSDRPCIVAAKVELATFTNSGVLEGEAMVLRHLHKSMPNGSVPIFCEYLRNVPTLTSPAALSGEDHLNPGEAPGPPTVRPDSKHEITLISAIIMEYLPGEDMARLRDRYLTNLRRVSYLSKSMINSVATSVRSYSVGAENIMEEARVNDEHYLHHLPAMKREEAEISHVLVKQERENGDFLIKSEAESLPSQQQQAVSSRRINIKDAVYLCADVLLPHLKAMHEAGVIHRDVKPSNCVRVGTTSGNKEFKLVDFGLSKSFIVPADSSLADRSYVWTRPWSIVSENGESSQQQMAACLRKERPVAEFRGTSMYASLRVHQLKDYCRRDDLWSLWYVFCDLISGGLPWMISASHRDRDLCQSLKEDIHGNDNDHVGELLFGPAFHSRVTAGRDRESLAQDQMDRLKLRLPNFQFKVELLRKAFQHLCSLRFSDEPDYSLMEECLRGFNEGNFEALDFEDVPSIEWDMPEHKTEDRELRCGQPYADDEERMFEESCTALSLIAHVQSLDKGLNHCSDLLRDLRMAKADYNSRNVSYYSSLSEGNGGDDAGGVKAHLFADWMAAAYDVIFVAWDVTKREKWGSHRSNDDEYRRENYVRRMELCQEYAKRLEYFHDLAYFDATSVGLNKENGRSNDDRPRKRRKQAILVSRQLLMELERKIEQEIGKPFAPPPKISFSA